MAISFPPSQASSLWQLWQQGAKNHPDAIALYDPHAKPPVRISYKDTFEQINAFGAGLRSLGIQFGEKVALIADNSPRWLIADQGILAIGAANATRSSQAERSELLYIIEHSDSVAIVVENLATLKKLEPELHTLPVKQIILLSDETPPEGAFNFQQLLTRGSSKDLGIGNVDIKRDTLATLIYTSGTTAKPKGVMLTHGNFLFEVEAAQSVLKLNVNEKVLNILPTWHSYERTFEYFAFSQGCTEIYTNLRMIKKDLKEQKPHYMVAVPRLWESIYEGVQKNFRDQPANKQRLVNFFFKVSHKYIVAKRIFQGLNVENLYPSLVDKLVALPSVLALWGLHKLGDKLVYQKVREATGGQLKYVVSGGGSIAEHLEDFYEIVGIEILGGYGLTETSPITHVRCPNRNIRGGDGQPVLNTETRIVDMSTRVDVPIGQQGLVLIRGPQVMQGYYKNPEATAKAIDPQGWFDTGDLGYVSKWDDLVITGRAKDTIVLTNGENIEPQPIEDACIRSAYIDQVVLVGQDQKQLGVLIVPNLSALEAASLVPADSILADILPLLNNPKIRNLYREELNREVQNRPGYSINDRIGVFEFLPEPFTIDNGFLTQTFKIRRNIVFERYQDIIVKMFTS
ncbi:long-chain-fatty-acid--CoA ligase [Pseudanabaena sp. lw0831]|uniref:AMP-dependent synthetase/ligase n=1 Tax=Pseudanabaena sp. lw0831 TaxID=1357935 RepID=UPI001916A7B7|nr:AMP-binding protein [Pseudanabaena sp. lw0831]GBO52813.1 long-chain-fatty-acid--CoA ligase [Pseudanabaena sp. lw0831]